MCKGDPLQINDSAVLNKYQFGIKVKETLTFRKISEFSYKSVSPALQASLLHKHILEKLWCYCTFNNLCFY